MDFIKMIMAGFIISIAGFCNITIGGVAGAVLFAWGLIVIINTKTTLYTGSVAFVKDEDFDKLPIILFGNAIGCALGALLFVPTEGAIAAATAIINARCVMTPFFCILPAVICGFIMTIAVHFAKQNNYLPLLFGIPLFILSGFPHCVADIFYILMTDFHSLAYSPIIAIVCWMSTVCGNTFGCLIPKWTKII